MTTELQKAVVVELYYRSEAIRQLEAALCDAEDPEASARLRLQIATDRAAIGPIIQAVIAARWPCAAALLAA